MASSNTNDETVDTTRPLVARLYWAEIYGMAFFATMMEERRDNHTERCIWECLWRVEERTSRHIRQFLGTATVVDDRRRTMHETHKGIAQAKMWCHLPWKELIDTMVNWVEPYHREYETLRHKGCPIFDLVADHETAIWEFLCAEQQQMPNALGFLERHLERYPLSSLESYETIRGCVAKER